MTSRFKGFSRRRNTFVLAAILIATLACVSFFNKEVSANHPVLVEGNCDSPVPGTTLVAPGTCGDFDGDGRIGTAEDTDGADRIFGTLAAALGPGTGAAAGTGANHNGTITIVNSGRFAETLNILPGVGFNHGNVTLQAAPGVDADIDAVLQGDPGGNNVTRQGGVGITINASGSSTVTLRNLNFRNFTEGVRVLGASRVTIDNCRFENNVNYGIRVQNTAVVGIFRSSVASTGYRNGSGVPLCPAGGCIPAPGHGIAFEDSSSGSVADTIASGNYNFGLANTSLLGAAAVRYDHLWNDHNGGGAVSGATKVTF